MENIKTEIIKTKGEIPMKCIKYTDGKVSRVSEKTAETLVDGGKAMYIPKSIWKMEVRDIINEEFEVVVASTIDNLEVKPKKKREKKTKKEIKSEKNKLKKLESTE